MAKRPQISFINLATILLLFGVATTQAVGANKANDGGKGDIMPSSEDLVIEACKNITNREMSEKMHFKEELCISVLRSDSRSASARDPGDLVIIALDLLSRNISEVAGLVSEISRGYATRNLTELAFQYCEADYGVMVKTFPVCRNIFLNVMKPGGNKAEYRDDITLPLQCMDRIGKAATDCSGYLNLANVVTAEYNNVIKHASLVWGLMEIALNFFGDDYRWDFLAFSLRAPSDLM